MTSTFFLILTSFLSSLVVALIATPIVRYLAFRIGVLDAPSERKIHKNPIPHLGGPAIFLGWLTGSIMVLINLPEASPLWGIFTGSFCILALGIYDDVVSVNPRLKLAGQIISATLTYLMGVSITHIQNPFTGALIQFPLFISFFLTIVFIVACINIINLIDGSDGLAAGICGIAAVFFAFISFSHYQLEPGLLAVSLLGAVLGFLYFNFPPAKIFMGDSGSMFLGYILATISITGISQHTFTASGAIPLFVLGIPVLDVAYAIWRRIKNKQGIFSPDRGHFHHILMDLEFNHRQVALFLYALSTALGFLACIINLFNGVQQYLVALVLGIIVMAIAWFFIVTRRDLLLRWLKRFSNRL